MIKLHHISRDYLKYTFGDTSIADKLIHDMMAYIRENDKNYEPNNRPPKKKKPQLRVIQGGKED